LLVRKEGGRRGKRKKNERGRSWRPFLKKKMCAFDEKFPKKKKKKKIKLIGQLGVVMSVLMIQFFFPFGIGKKHPNVFLYW